VLLLGPALVIVGGALLIPSLNLLVQSFAHSLGYGQISYHFTLSNYTSALTDPLYRSLALRSFGLGAVTGVAGTWRCISWSCRCSPAIWSGCTPGTRCSERAA
jgi:ABC-type spermidine/putrescine transport system permease subunit I